MIKRVTLKNIGSVLNEATFDFTKGKYDYHTEMLNDDIVNPVAIFGSNGSGKTVFLIALKKLSDLMNKDLGSFIIFPFLGSENDGLSYIKIEGSLNNVGFLYSLTYSFLDRAIVSEFLEFDNIKVERNSSNYSLTLPSAPMIRSYPLENGNLSVIKHLGNLESKNTDGTTIEFLNNFYSYLRDMVYIDHSGKKGQHTNAMKELLVKRNDDVNELLTSYDHFPQFDLDLDDNKIGRRELYFRIKGEKNFLPSFLMSEGMKAHSVLLTLLVENKDKERLFIVDEIERNLHSFVSNKLISNFNIQFPKTQLIFSSHNTNLLQHLRPDQIFFSRYDNTNKSTYGKLSDEYKDIREINNIEKMYFKGKIGG